MSVNVDGIYIEATATITWVGTTTPCPVGQFYAEYYNYTPQGGTYTGPENAPAFPDQPVFTRCEDSINYDWEDGGPGNGVSNDYFMARWTGTFNFDDGDYTFIAKVDDGIRVWVDGNLIIDEWTAQVATEYLVQLSLTAGYHEIKVEYFERTGMAICQVSWEKLFTPF